jgi:uncharacterized protein YbcI
MAQEKIFIKHITTDEISSLSSILFEAIEQIKQEYGENVVDVFTENDEETDGQISLFALIER